MNDDLYYYSLFESFSDMVSDPDTFSRDAFIELLGRLAEYFNVTKGVTEYYMSAQDEKAGNGEILIDYDTGKGDKLVIRRRIAAPSGVVMCCSFYTAEDLPMPSKRDMFRLDLIARMILSLVSRNRLIKLVEKLGFYDGQGFPNYRSFIRYVRELLIRQSLEGMVVIKYNLRHFSLVNHDLGRSLGDVVIRRHFDLVSSCISNVGIVSRLGGDNFLMLCDKEDLEAVLKILNGTPVIYDESNGKRVIIQTSAGIYVIPEGRIITRPDELLDIIMPTANLAQTGKSADVLFADDKLMNIKKANMKIQKNFSSALEDKEFVSYYQPQVDITNGKIVGAEALCRWIKDGQVIMPGSFIPVLEQGMDICKLDFYILEMVCRDIKSWLDEGKPVVRISVNMSRKHLIDVDFVKHLTRIIDSCGISREYIEIEFTETVDNAGFGELKQTIQNLRKEGIYTSVDDFGAGYTSLALLSDIPWNIIKIDRSFLPLPDSDEKDKDVIIPIMKHIALIADELGMDCVVEGVENEEHVRILKENNCKIAQGFFYHKPMPKADFEKLLYEAAG